MEQINYVDGASCEATITPPVSKKIKALQITAFVFFLLHYVYNYFISGELRWFLGDSIGMEFDTASLISTGIGLILKVTGIVILLCICSNKVSRVCCGVFLCVLLLPMALMNSSIEIVDGWSNFLINLYNFIFKLIEVYAYSLILMNISMPKSQKTWITLVPVLSVLFLLSSFCQRQVVPPSQYNVSILSVFSEFSLILLIISYYYLCTCPAFGGKYDSEHKAKYTPVNKYVNTYIVAGIVAIAAAVVILQPYFGFVGTL